MRVVVIKGFPFSGHDLLAQLLRQLTNANFLDLNNLSPPGFLETTLDIPKSDQFYCICLINHPQSSFSYWLSTQPFKYRSRRNLEFWLEFNLLTNKSWKEYYQDAHQKNDWLIHYQDLVRRPKTIIRQIAAINKISYLGGYGRTIDVRAMANHLWPQPAPLPTWFQQKLQDELQSTYESLGYEWAPCLSPTRLNMQYKKSKPCKGTT